MNIEKFPLKVIFEKSGEMIYFSQLDINRLLERALRRSGLPLYFTQGFSPRVKLSFGNALKLGVSGTEELTLYFTRNVSFEEFVESIRLQVPEGITFSCPDSTRQ